ncbi:hypothetical protein GCM10022200_26710 [Microbacterium awajiense]|uniref:Right handed beta helix domain-containing protein n=1 Tax=Microbacterium awajiense TaxID=415214 RepID=A0ABP7AW76_9MICO
MLPKRHGRRGISTALVASAAIGSMIATATVGATAAAAAESEQRIHVAVDGSDSGAGTAADPASLIRAQELVRALNSDMSADIEVVLANGTYRLTEPLMFDASDSGSNGYSVRWTAADGATPVISGAVPVSNWTLADAETGIYAASVPADAQTRNLYVDGESAVRAQTRFSRPAQSAFTADGLTMTSQMAFLRALSAAELAEVELRGINSFTDRYSGVDGLSPDGTVLEMANPAWHNNTWGWDHLASPFHESGFYAENALAFLDAENEWFLDTAADTLYYKPVAGADIDSLEVELPRLETLVSISGTTDDQVHHLSFDGLAFTGATWNEPTETGGYADQQTGGYLSVGDDYPEGGYPTFESSRPHWRQVPSAVQISAATDVTITESAFYGLGGSGLGIGNDATAHLSGVGLGTQRITVHGSTFTEIGSNAITIGGIEQQAHHPGTLADGTRDPAVSDATVARMTVSDITITENRIWDAADTYTSGVGILMTYTADSVIAHNDVTDMPYGAINTGYGWGANDAGGSSDYLNRGLYDHQPIFTTPTTARDNLITANYTARFGLRHTDLGGFYNLSANPGSVWSENYIVEPRNRAFYPDEGSRDLTFNDNVAVNGDWFGANFRAPNTGNLSGAGNWISEGNTIVRANRNTLVEATNFAPADVVNCEITDIRFHAGVPVERRTGTDPDRPGSACLDTSVETVAGESIVSAGFADLAADHTGFAIGADVPDGWSVTALDPDPATSVTTGTTASQRWSIAAPSELTDAIMTAPVTITATSDTVSAVGTEEVSVGGAVQAPFKDTGNGAYLAGQYGDEFALWQAGADIWGVNQNDDDYAAIYVEDAVGDGDSITVKVTDQEHINDWTKSGLVLRNDIATPFSPGGYLVLVVTPAKGVILSSDTDNNGTLDHNVIAAGVKAPVSLQLSRDGDVVTAKYSKDDGATWTTVGTRTTVGADAVQDAGIVHVSHDVITYGRADFTDLSVSSLGDPGDLVSVDVSTAHTFVSMGDTVAFTVTGEDADGRVVPLDAGDIILTSDNPADVVEGTRVTFPAEGERTITATVGTVSASVQVEVGPEAIDPGPLLTYSNVDASFSQGDGSYEVTAAGTDMFQGFGIVQDQFGALYAPDAAGAQSVVSVRVAEYDSIRRNSKAALVLRNDITAPGSAAGYVSIAAQQESGVTLFADSNGDGYLDHYQGFGNAKIEPVHLRLARDGDVVTGYVSEDGVTWQPVGDPVTLVNADESLDVGLAYVSAHAATAGTATFDTLRVANESVPVVDEERPVVELRSPASAGPFPVVDIEMTATDDVGLSRIVANIYQDGKLVKSTQTRVEGGAKSGTHSATVSLPDGEYSMKYNAEDLAGNIARTRTVTFTVDATAPVASVKSGEGFTVVSGTGYEKVSFKLFDAGKIDKVVINGVVKDLTDNTWSDVNFVRPGVFGAVAGENVLVVYDVAGNSSTRSFTLVG